MTNRLKPLAVALAAVTGLVLLTGCQEPAAPTAIEVVRPVKLHQLRAGEQDTVRQFPARVHASEESEISFRIPGTLVEFLVQPAQEVEKGQLLARLDDRDFRNELALRQADHELAQRNYDRVSSLKKKNLVSPAEFDSALTSLQLARAALQLAEDKVAYSALRAPFDGRVAQTQVENHQFVQAQQTILVLQDNQVLDVTIQVPESILGQIPPQELKTGYQPQVRFNAQPAKAYPVRYKEHATQVTPGSQSYEVTFSLPVPQDLIVYPGMAATLDIDFAQFLPPQAQQGLVVPLTALQQDDASGQLQVWRYDDESKTVEPVTVVTLGITQEGMRLLSPMESGEWVVAAGVNQLRPGQTVKPLQRERGL